MRIAITGATGFVARHLLPALTAAGHEPVALVRSRPGRELELGARAYEPEDVASVRAALAGCEGVINLAGANVLGGRWTTAFLATLRRSRLETTRALVAAMAELEPAPRVLVSASAVGIYGAREPDVVCTEETEALGSDFLAVLCRDWEAAARRAESDGTRVVCVRTGVVLGRDGGALERMVGPFKWGLGGRIGNGRQIMSWIHVTDLVRLLLFCIEEQTLVGPVNATAPQPVSNRELTAALARALRRPAFLPVPTFALKALFGRGASVLTTGQRVLPAAAERQGFTFEHRSIEVALAEIFG
jgi:uncharacterized protein (TIGR01777 family)